MLFYKFYRCLHYIIFFKVWIKPNGEMPFLYGNHALKAHVGRISDDTPEHQGVVVYSMSDVPLVSILLPDTTFLSLVFLCLYV